MTTRLVAAGALLAAALAGCATAQPDNAALTEARRLYAMVSGDPLVISHAPLELQRAEAALRRAEAAHAGGTDAREVGHLAYVAGRQAQVAREIGAVAEARNAVATAELARGSAALQARNAELERQLAEMQAERTERGLVMTLGDVLFATGRAELTPGADARLARLASFLQRYPSRTVRIEGYADSTGSTAANQRLSEQRALAVRDALLLRGVPPGRMLTQGFGETRPVAADTTAAGRQANRRVEIVISDDAATAEVR